MIPMNDFSAEPEVLIQAQLAAAERVLRSGWYVLGKEVSQFEQQWANQCHLPYSVGVANGLEALEIGLMALHLQPGDEVITTPMTAFATALAIIQAGLTPVFADIDPQTGLLDPASVERCISSRTKAVLLVHLYGHIHQMNRWLKLCKAYNLFFLEDCAQAHLARWQNRYGGSFGEWGAYSFYPTKNLGAIGDAGAIVTHQETIAQQAKILRNYGQTERYHHPEIGLNSRLDELQAALLSTRLNWLDSFTARRQAIACTYYQHITNPAIQHLSPPTELENHVYHLFVIRTQERDLLSQHLKDHGIATLIHYPIPLHQQKPCQALRIDPQGLSQTEYHAEHCLSIPCHPQLSPAQLDKIIEVINEFK
jgi:dTDP-4-amino-4,6-dideoxygalactose transaminase